MKAGRQDFEQLPMGKIYLHAPVEMKVGDRRGVDAHVGVNVPDEILQGRVRPGEQIKEALLRVSYEMIATLHGPGFKINPTTPEQQTVADGLPTVWEWEIEANQDGAQELEATLYALVPNTVVPTGAPANTRQRIDAYSQTILVSVKAQSWGEWLKSLREEIDAVKAIAIALGGVATAAIAWLGISGSWRRRSPTRPRKSGTRAVKSGGSRS